MLFVHDVAPEWKDRIPTVTHVDGTARIQTVDRAEDLPLVARMLECFERRTGLPVVVNTSLNTAGRPMVDDPRDALECFGSAPVDLLAIGPFVVRRRGPRCRLNRSAHACESRDRVGRFGNDVLERVTAVTGRSAGGTRSEPSARDGREPRRTHGRIRGPQRDRARRA